MKRAFSVLLLISMWCTWILHGQILREDFREGPPHWPVGTDDVESSFLTLHRYGKDKDMLKLSHHPFIKNDPHYIWNGQCKSPVMAGFHFEHPLDLSGANALVKMRTKMSGKSTMHIALKIGDDWIVQEEGTGAQKDWQIVTQLLNGSSVTYRKLEADSCVIGEKIEKPDLKKVSGIGFVSPKPANRSQDCIRLDWFELESSFTDAKIAGDFGKKRDPQESPKFIEDDIPFFRSALVFKHKGKENRVRRGVIVNLKHENTWACFDPDRLCWVVVWKAPKGEQPISLDSMAGVSFPDKKAKANKPPILNGKVIDLLDESGFEKEAEFKNKKTSVGKQWLGVRLDIGQPVLHYRDGVDHMMTKIEADETNVYKIFEKIKGNGSESVEGRNKNGEHYSADGFTTADDYTYHPTRIFPSTWSPDELGKKHTTAPFEIQEMPIPKTPRPIRPTDFAFLPDGTLLVCTLDGDVWRVEKAHSPGSEWKRIAFGLFEPMAIEVTADSKIFTVGRDQITELIDHNGDHHIDEYRCASDAFIQTLHTRDYTMSLKIGSDGSFYISKAGLFNTGGGKAFKEMSEHRGTVLKISRDGKKVEVLADGLRVPFLGLRNDGELFVSDQQGHYVPTTPVYQLGKKKQTFSFEFTNHQKTKQLSAPLLFFPYQHNRSAAGFTDFPITQKLKDFSPAFVHTSWDGRLFTIATPEKGLPFAYRWPLQLDFPSLHAEMHPQRGELFTIGLGISGYKPTTRGTQGMAVIRQESSFPTPREVNVSGDQVIIKLNRKLTENESIIAGESKLRLYDVKRSEKYGSGHFLATGEPGEHHLSVKSMRLASDRETISLKFETLFKADVFDLMLSVNIDNKKIPLHIYVNPQSFPEADKAKLKKIEEGNADALRVGNPKKGKDLFASYACAGCHSVANEKLTGPPLGGIASRQNAKQLRESILYPEKIITPGYEPNMPSFEGVIQAQELEDILAYLQTLR